MEDDPANVMSPESPNKADLSSATPGLETLDSPDQHESPGICVELSDRESCAAEQNDTESNHETAPFGDLLDAHAETETQIRALGVQIVDLEQELKAILDVARFVEIQTEKKLGLLHHRKAIMIEEMHSLHQLASLANQHDSTKMAELSTSDIALKAKLDAALSAQNQGLQAQELAVVRNLEAKIQESQQALDFQIKAARELIQASSSNTEHQQSIRLFITCLLDTNDIVALQQLYDEFASMVPNNDIQQAATPDQLDIDDLLQGWSDLE